MGRERARGSRTCFLSCLPGCHAQPLLESLPHSAPESPPGGCSLPWHWNPCFPKPLQRHRRQEGSGTPRSTRSPPQIFPNPLPTRSPSQISQRGSSVRSHRVPFFSHPPPFRKPTSREGGREETNRKGNAGQRRGHGGEASPKLPADPPQKGKARRLPPGRCPVPGDPGRRHRRSSALGGDGLGVGGDSARRR